MTSDLSKVGRGLITDRANTAVISAVSAWEIATKVRLGRLPSAAELIEDFVGEMERQRIAILDVSAKHGIRAGSLPGPHKDPFDRMLIAQALGENIPILSNDQALDDYGITRLW
jgi:PIN domain nuclease of toxin-antitoxin system